jgi:hypothetical protein
MSVEIGLQMKLKVLNLNFPLRKTPHCLSSSNSINTNPSYDLLSGLPLILGQWEFDTLKMQIISCIGNASKDLSLLSYEKSAYDSPFLSMLPLPYA